VQRSARSDLALDDAEVVDAIADAMHAASLTEVRKHGKQPAVDAYRHAGTVCANHLIGRHPERVEAELAEADREWNMPGRIGPNWTALISGYRDALREYTEGKD
jgi:hypothetical protein